MKEKTKSTRNSVRVCINLSFISMGAWMGLFAFPECDSNSCVLVRVRGESGGRSLEEETVSGAFGPCTHDCVGMCIWRGACTNLARLGNLNSLDAPRHHAFYASVYGHAYSTHLLNFAFGSRPCINQFLTEEVLEVTEVLI